MAYQPIMNAFRLTGEEASGQPSYMDALLKGFKGAQEAAETVNRPRKLQEEYLKQQLENKMNTPKAEGAQLAFDTDIGYKQALTNQANRPPAITGETAQLFALRNSLPEGPDRDKVDQIITLKSKGSNGTTVYDPKTGNPLVQIGGAAGKSGGGTFINPETGEVISQPTGSTATNLQGKILGTEAIKPYLANIVKKLPQFQNPSTKASLLGQKVANAFGGQNFDLPSQEASGKAAIKQASEGMIKTFGLNATGANRRAMEDIVTPRFGESEAGYKKRVLEQAKEYATNEKKAQTALSGGISLNNRDEPVTPTGAKGEARAMYKNGVLHFIPIADIAEARKLGYKDE